MRHGMWMRPALQKSEAVLMPALQREAAAERRFSDPYSRRQPRQDSFRPVTQPATTALSTYVRPRGSMAGRSVLRAVGVRQMPETRLGKPRYTRSRSAPYQTTWQGRR